ncbi:MAG TPA: hydrogenase maturation protein [Burkholderiaceae bacterium]|nr:hydrogenase maturation protein [Burkholderiaceae bacterium]
MRILLLAHSFNSLTQRLWIELEERGDEISLELDVNDAVTADAVRRFAPDLVLAPFLRRAIPEAVWRNVPCLVVHPGVPGDRGPSALDWAVQDGESRWGVTVLQANAEMDAGDVWASVEFAMRAASKGSLYRNEVTEAAVAAVLQALGRIASGGSATPLAQLADARGRLRPLMRQADRAIDWSSDSTETVLRKLHAADGVPGVADRVLGLDVHCYDGHIEGLLRGAPGAVIAQREQAICRATVDGAVWITHLKDAKDTARPFKLPAAMVLGARLDDVPEIHAPDAPPEVTWNDIRYEEFGAVGVLHFSFYNGAMSTRQCERLVAAYRAARERPTRVIVLAGGHDFWSNGIHLNVIEASQQPAEESWSSINAIDDLARAILETQSHLTVAALQGNAGAGGVFLALAADRVVARRGVVLNPHYKGMGNLYGSEYWTYLLPRRLGTETARQITEGRLPMGAMAAQRLGLIDDCYGESPADFLQQALVSAGRIAEEDFDRQLRVKRGRRAADEARKPLAAYRAEELERMRLNFFGFDSSYHVARYNFVRKVPKARTPSYLARHRSTSGRMSATL